MLKHVNSKGIWVIEGHCPSCGTQGGETNLIIEKHFKTLKSIHVRCIRCSGRYKISTKHIINYTPIGS